MAIKKNAMPVAGLGLLMPGEFQVSTLSVGGEMKDRKRPDFRVYDIDKMTDKDKLCHLHDFAKKLFDGMEDLSPEISKLVSKHFWDLL